MAFWKLYKVPLSLSILSLVLYLLFAYNLERTDYGQLLFLYVSLWLGYLLILKFSKKHYQFLAIIAFLSRVVFIFSIPNLSQDFYRFIWDGRMVLEGLNPYLYTPESFMSNLEFPVAQAKELFLGMGPLNGSHFTNYPPINQLCFSVAAVFAGKSILGSAFVMRLIIIAADLGILVFGTKLLKVLKLPEHRIFWYFLNPFIIIELTGNLHFEGVMLFLLIWSLYLIQKGHWKMAAVAFALSISVKLMPLLFLPLFLRFFKKEPSKPVIHVDSSLGNFSTVFKNIDFKKLFGFYTIIGLFTLLLFLPFFSSVFIQNYASTVGLWFQKFEFNASIYYIAREIGYLFRGYNEIAVIGTILPVIVIIVIMGLGYFRKNSDLKHLLQSMLLAFAIYLFMSTTVHPWYLATLLILSIFTEYKFPLVWSFIIIISYLAYANADNRENLWIIALEYVVVFATLIYDIKKDAFKTIENKKSSKRLKDIYWS